MRTLAFVILCVGWMLGVGQPSWQPMVVEAEGVAELGASREQAVRAAQRHALIQAVETACGVRVAGLEVGRDGALQLAARLAFAQGIVLRWTPTEPPRIGDGRVMVRLRAEVVPVSQLTTPADWREVWRTVGHPPIGLHLQFAGDPVLRTPTQHALQTLLQQSLSEMGVQLRETAPANSWQLVAEVRVQPRKRWDDPDAPYGTGDLFASWKVSLTLALKPPAGTLPAPLSPTPAPLTLLQGEATGVSSVGDADAVQRALKQILQRTPPDTWRVPIAHQWVNHLLYGVSTDPVSQPKTKEARTNDAQQTVARSKPTARKPAAARPKQR